MKVIYIVSRYKEDAMELAKKVQGPWTHIEYVDSDDQARDVVAFQKKNISVKTVILVSESFGILS